MQELVAGVVRERLSDVSIVKLLDGAIVFETECSYDRLNFFCFNNIFAVIDILEAHDPELHIRKISAMGKNNGASLSEKALAVISENNKKIKSFRLVCSNENKPVSINENAKRSIENFIAHNSALKVDGANPDTEYWFLYRREGFSLFMKRLTRPSDKNLHPGELPPQLAWLLCRAADLRPGETVIDPFCGYGSIPETALKHFHIKKVYALDTDSRCIKITGERQSMKSERCEIHRADFFTAPPFLPAGGADAIITDPPWGMYKETNIPLEEFYGNMLGLFFRLLRTGGRAVILTGAVKELESVAGKAGTFNTSRTIPILVSGKKASVFILEKV